MNSDQINMSSGNPNIRNLVYLLLKFVPEVQITVIRNRCHVEDVEEIGRMQASLMAAPEIDYSLVSELYRELV